MANTTCLRVILFDDTKVRNICESSSPKSKDEIDVPHPQHLNTQRKRTCNLNRKQKYSYSQSR